MFIRWSSLNALAHISQLSRLPLIPSFFGITLLLASAQLRTCLLMAVSIMLSDWSRTSAMVRAMAEAILQYVLGYGAWYGLSTIGEPPLTKLKPCGEEGSGRPNLWLLQSRRSASRPTQDPMPAWLIFLFFALVSARYIFSFLVSSSPMI